MHIPVFLAFVFLALGNIALAGPASQVNIETRTLDEIYEAALREPGTLRVAWGGDSTSLLVSHLWCSPTCYQSKPHKSASRKHSEAASQKSNWT